MLFRIFLLDLMSSILFPRDPSLATVTFRFPTTDLVVLVDFWLLFLLLLPLLSFTFLSIFFFYSKTFSFLPDIQELPLDEVLLLSFLSDFNCLMLVSFQIFTSSSLILLPVIPVITMVFSLLHPFLGFSEYPRSSCFICFQLHCKSWHSSLHAAQVFIIVLQSVSALCELHVVPGQFT